ncbi:MAG: hypothetical protein KAQ66_05910 [Rhodospirillaceae bacterium]|nr:hypothetical protein [Rhodospirillaceae bacterium]
METIKLKLGPGKEALVGAMAVRNEEDREISLSVRGDGPVLRRDLIIDHSDADTPALKIYYLVTLMYMVPDSFSSLTDYFMKATAGMIETVPASVELVTEIGQLVIEEQYGPAHQLCFELLAFEEIAAQEQK